MPAVLRFCCAITPACHYEPQILYLTKAMRHVSYLVKDVCVCTYKYIYACMFLLFFRVGKFEFHLYSVLWPVPSRTGACWICHTNGSNFRSKHKPDALAGLLKGCCNDKELHTQLCF